MARGVFFCGVFPVLFLSALLAGCATSNPFQLADDQAAYLANHRDVSGKTKTSFLFLQIDETSLDEGLFTPAIKMQYPVPPGRYAVLLQVVHAPDGYMQMGGALVLKEMLALLVADLEAGKIYQARGEFVGDRATVFLVDDSGERVSDRVVGELEIAAKGMLTLERKVYMNQ